MLSGGLELRSGVWEFKVGVFSEMFLPRRPKEGSLKNHLSKTSSPAACGTPKGGGEIQGLYRNILYWGYIGRMEKKMETIPKP